MTDTDYCDRCGRALGEADGAPDHRSCREARELEPPRYCARCGRRTVVKVTPDGWSSHCTRHGLTVSPR
jgi:hypothetical protein